MSTQILAARQVQAAPPIPFLRLRSPGRDLAHPYFHRECWSEDDAGFVFRAGTERFYFDIETRSAISLTERVGEPIHAVQIARDGRRIFFFRGQDLCVMALPTDAGLPEEIEVLHRVDPGTRPLELSPNADDSGLAIMVEVKDVLRRISYLDVVTGKLTDCFEGHRRLGHLQMNPARTHLIMFADQHDSQNFQRMYTVKTSGREHFPFYHQQPGEWVTHECFSRDGRWVTFTVAQPIKGLHVIGSDGRGARRVDEGIYWHACPSSDASVIAADMYDGEVRLVQRDSGEYRTVTARWMPKGRMVPKGHLHPHPCLSRTGRWLLHVDGSSGRGELRLIDLRQLG